MRSFKKVFYPVVTLIFFLLSDIPVQSQDVTLRIPTGHKKRIEKMSVSDNEQLVATMSDDEVKVWDLHSGTELVSFPNSRAIDNIIFPIKGSADFGLVQDGEVFIISGQNLTRRRIAGYGSSQTKLGISDPHGKYLYVTGFHWLKKSGFLYQIDISSGSIRKIIEIAAKDPSSTSRPGFRSVSISPDGTKLIAEYDGPTADNPDYTHLFVNATNGEIVKKILARSQYFTFLGNDQVIHTGRSMPGEDKALNLKDPVFASLFSYPDLKLVKKIQTPIVYMNFWGTQEGIFKNPGDQSITGLTYWPADSVFYQTINFKNGSVKVRAYKEKQPLNHSNGRNILLSDQNTVLFCNAMTIGTWQLSDGKLTTFKSGNVMEYPQLSYNPKRDMLAIGPRTSSEMKKKIQIVDFRQDGIQVHTLPVVATSEVKWSPNGKTALAYSEKEGGFVVIDADNPESYKVHKSFGGGYYITWSPDGKIFAQHGRGNIRFFDASTFKTIRFVKGDDKFVNNGERNAGAFSADGKYFAASVIRPDPANTGEERYWLVCYEVGTGNLLWEKPVAQTNAQRMFQGISFSSDGQLVSAIEFVYGQYGFNPTVNFYNIKTGEIVRKVTGFPGTDQFLGQNPDGSKLVFYNEGEISVQNRNDGSVLFKKKTQHIDRRGMAFLRDESFIFFADNTSGLQLLDLKRQLEAGRLITFSDNNEFGLLNQQNYFEGSQDGMNMMYLVRGTVKAPLQSLFEKLYTPRLFQMILNRSEPGAPEININTLKQPPVVKIDYKTGHRNLTVEDDDVPETKTLTSPEVTITVTARAPGDRVSEIRLYHNGKLLSSNTRNLEVADDDNEDHKSWRVTLQPGSNSFSAIGINSQRTESVPARLALNYAPSTTGAQKQTAEVQKSTTTLYLLVIGINQYKNSRYNLNYALADAKGFNEKIKNSCGKIMKDCKAYFISDADATREKILNAINEIPDKATPQDMFVFYYAGHGVMSEGEGADFFLVPHDVTQLYGNDDILKTKGISSNELKNKSAEIKAQKQLFILDACQSAGALQSMAMRGAAEEKAIAQLARSTGTHWLTASGSDQFASEFDKLGHGAFTYVLMDGLSGKAAMANGAITVNSLKAYLETTVPEITEKYKGTAQYPASYGYGQDFPVATKSE